MALRAGASIANTRPTRPCPVSAAAVRVDDVLTEVHPDHPCWMISHLSPRGQPVPSRADPDLVCGHALRLRAVRTGHWPMITEPRAGRVGVFEPQPAHGVRPGTCAIAGHMIDGDYALGHPRATSEVGALAEGLSVRHQRIASHRDWLQHPVTQSQIFHR